jgi:hypothetical protein
MAQTYIKLVCATPPEKIWTAKSKAPMGFCCEERLLANLEALHIYTYPPPRQKRKLFRQVFNLISYPVASAAGLLFCGQK